ncbi:MAG: hypothetical protein H6574_12680 [Lewinellaceae bacterium]|nr:hypothetical protein [Lewinellaceae bacterium]
MAAFFKKYRRDVVYMTAIVGSMGCAVFFYQGKLNRALLDELTETSRIARGQTEQFSRYFSAEIQKEADAFPEKNKGLWRRTRQISTLIENAKLALWATSNSKYIVLEPVHRLSSTEIQDIQLKFKVLADSLVLLLGDADPLWIKSIQHLLYSDSAAYTRANWAALSSDLGPKQAVAGLTNLIARIEAAGLIANQTCYQETQPRGIIEHYWIPVLSTARSVLRPGELFEADIFLTEYTPRTENRAVFVNDKPIAINDGLAHYRGQFHRPGVHQLNVRIDAYNPLTKEIKPFYKTFEVLVVEPCPEEE